MKITKSVQIILIIAVLLAAGSVAVARRMDVAAAFDFEGEHGQPGQVVGPIVAESLRNDVSEPLTIMAESAPEPQRAEGIEVYPIGPEPPVIDDGKFDASAVQTQLQGDTYMPLPIHNFEGGYNVDGGVPPDTNGDVGFDPGTSTKYYMQWLNTSFWIWDVTDPANVQLLLGPLDGNVLFTGFGGPCEETDDGDPIVLFDHLANRWMGSQFGNVDEGPPFYQCIVVSETADPTGAWYRYEYQWPSGFNDYPKFGVWPDAYYISANQFTGATGVGVAAFERDQMLIGQPATMIYFDVSDANGAYRSLLPADLDGPPPPLGTPNYFTAWHDGAQFPPSDAIHLWEFTVNWANPNLSSFGVNGFPNEVIPTVEVNPSMCGGSRNCIPQPGGYPVDALAPRLMFRLAYRYNDGLELMAANHTVDVDGADHAGIHWMELHRDGGAWSMYQEGVYAPDTDHRWMGSVALDQKGNLALGYSVSSETTYPSIRYAGRLAGDPLGLLPQVETELIAGTGYQETIAGRWGDYSMMSIDPTDDCTFWFTQEYYGNISTATWQTRIGSFVFPSCLGPVGDLEGTVTESGTGLAIEDASVRATAPATQPAMAQTDANGDYAMILGVGTYDVTASKYGYLPTEVSGVSIISGTTATEDIILQPAASYVISGTVTDAVTGWPLYARITVQGDPFDPPAPLDEIWTDPVSGEYSVALAEAITYTLTVEPWVDGYMPGVEQITPLTGDVDLDVAVTPDDGLCLAPGYEQSLEYFEDFEANDGGYTAGIGEWEWGVPTYPAGLTAFSGVNVWGTDLSGDASDPPPDAHVLTTTLLTVPPAGGYLQWWDWYGAELADTRDVYVDGTLVWSDSANARNQRFWDKHYADLSPWAGQSVLAEFILDVRGGGSGPDGWYIDDVSIAEVGSCLPVPGGLVVGNVYEDGTTTPLTGAMVENDSGEMTTAMETPDDPAVDDAFYTLFSPSGQHVFTATMSGYGADVETIDVLQGTTQALDFFLPEALYAVALPGDMEASGMNGTVVTYTIQVTNTGNTLDTFDLFVSGNAWDTALSTDEISLGAGAVGLFYVQVTIPVGAPDGADDMAIITAASQGDPSQMASVVLTTTAIRDDYLVDIPIVLNVTEQ